VVCCGRYLDIFGSFWWSHKYKYDKSHTFFIHNNYLVVLLNAFEFNENIYLKMNNNNY